jgi:hypothetical protein
LIFGFFELNYPCVSLHILDLTHCNIVMHLFASFTVDPPIGTSEVLKYIDILNTETCKTSVFW